MRMNAPTKSVEPLHLIGTNGLPKYLQLRDTLISAIDEGRWRPGDKLPAEDVLAEMTGLSLGTVQRSLRMLVQDNRLVRRHGAGTYVADRQAPLGGPFQHFRFLDDSGERLLPIYTKVVRRFAVTEAGPWDAWLSSDRLVCIDRIFSINREFDAYVRIYFCSRRFPELNDVDTDALKGVSFKDLISRRYHTPTSSYTQKLQIDVFPDAICKAIKTPAGTTGAQMEIVAQDSRGEAIYVQQVYLPPNSRQLLIQP